MINALLFKITNLSKVLIRIQIGTSQRILLLKFELHQLKGIAVGLHVKPNQTKQCNFVLFLENWALIDPS
jgi:hypothetical protein